MLLILVNMQTAMLCSICKSGQTVTDAESRAFTSEEVNDRSRTGIPRSLARHDMGLSTVIGRTDKDASGRIIDGAMRSTMGRLRAWDFRTQAHSPTDRNLRQAFSELDRLKDKLGVSDAVIEKTAYIYRKAQERGLVRGRTISAMIGAALYIACRETGAARTLKDIADTGNIKRNDIGIMKNVTKSGISAGKDPMGLAASVLYLACLNTGESKTQTDIAEAAGVTEVTVRNRYKNLKSHLDLI